MILVRLMGGLGNQMFQYAAGKAAALRTRDTLMLDPSLVMRSQNSHHEEPNRTFDLDVFGLPDRLASPFEVALFNGHPDSSILKVTHRLARMTGRFPLLIQLENQFCEDLLLRKRRNACLVGRWQSESYFADQADAIRKSFVFRNLDPTPYFRRIAVECNSDVSVVLQTRRTDYVTHPIYSRTLGALTPQYYFDALDAVRSRLRCPRLKLYVGGEDLPWCVETFGRLANVTFLELDKSKRGYCSHLWLLSQFQNHIISNSTFAWWGAWLGEKPGSVIVAPSQWVRDSAKRCEKILPTRWTAIRNDFERLA